MRADLQPDEIAIIGSCVETGMTPKQAHDMLLAQFPSRVPPRSLPTVSTVYRVLTRFQKCFAESPRKSDAEMVGQAGADISYRLGGAYLERLLAYWKDRQEGRKVKDEPSTQRAHLHLLDLRDAVGELITCLEAAPRPEDWWSFQFDFLPLGGRDWAFMPQEWVAVSTPAFILDYEPRRIQREFGSKFAYLREHLEGSVFFEDLRALRMMAARLDEDLVQAAGVIDVQQDEGFCRAWAKLQKARQGRGIAMRTPIAPCPDWDVTTPCSFDYPIPKSVNLLSGLIPDLRGRYRQLISKLADLRRDLDLSSLDYYLTQCTCSYCRSWR